MNHVVADGEQAAGAINVSITTLDAALAGASPSVMKIDVEGYETPVLEGAATVLANEALHSVIMELNGSGSRFGFDESKLLEVMNGYGFQTFSYDPFSRKLTSLNSKNLHSGNTIFVRDVDRVMDRLISSPRFAVLGQSL
jgi:hypothetical protein